MKRRHPHRPADTGKRVLHYIAVDLASQHEDEAAAVAEAEATLQRHVAFELWCADHQRPCPT